MIAATNRDLDDMVAEGTFREDLFYRLNGFTIELPPLRKREGDVQLLIEHFLPACSRKMGKDVRTISPEALELLLSYSWPGNVRELQSVIKQAVLQTTGPIVLPEFLPKSVRNWGGDGGSGQQQASLAEDLATFIEERISAGSQQVYAETLELMERCLLTRVLHAHRGQPVEGRQDPGHHPGQPAAQVARCGISMEHVVNIGDSEAKRKVETEHEPKNSPAAV